MSNRHRGTDTDRAMRSRQVAEALGEDARANSKAFLLNFPFVQQNKEEFLRPDELDRKTQFELSGFLDKMASALSQAVSSLAIPAEASKLTQGISEFLSAFNRATAYVRLYGRTGKLSNREEQAIQEKFDSVKPSLEQILNAHAAGNPIPEFRAVLNAYDNIANNDLRPVDFSPPLNIPQPPQPPAAPGAAAAQPFLPIVGPNAPPRGPQGVAPPAPGPAVQPGPVAPPPPQPPAQPQFYLPLLLLQGANANQQAAYLLANQPVPPLRNRPARDAFAAAEQGRYNAYQADLARYRADLAAYNQGRPAAEQVAAPVAPQQPAQPPQQQGLTRAERNLVAELEGNRQYLIAAQAALGLNPPINAPGHQDPRQLRDDVNRGVEAVRRAEERAIRSGVINVVYNQADHGAPRTRFGRGMYGGVSADMAGMDEEYLDLKLHDGFVERGNWSGMMKALAGMPTHPYGAGIEAEEGEEMPIGVSGSSHRVGFYDGGDLMSDEEEPEDEMEDDDEYDREMAGRGQLDDVAERIQANRQKSELNVAKGGAKNMKEMLAKLKSKIRC